MCNCQSSGYTGCGCGGHSRFDGDGPILGRLRRATAQERATATALVGEADAPALLRYVLANELPLTPATVASWQQVRNLESGAALATVADRPLVLLPLVVIVLALGAVWYLSR